MDVLKSLASRCDAQAARIKALEQQNCNLRSHNIELEGKVQYWTRIAKNAQSRLEELEKISAALEQQNADRINLAYNNAVQPKSDCVEIAHAPWRCAMGYNAGWSLQDIEYPDDPNYLNGWSAGARFKLAIAKAKSPC